MAPPSTQPSPSSPAPRSFPPPALADVPLEYIVDQLHNLAPRYWNKLDTTDCMIVIPLPRRSGLPVPSSVDPNDGIRRDTNARATRLILRLHVDYLCAQSTLLRALFSDAPLAQPASSLQAPHDHKPHLMAPSGPHPVLFLPVPDPRSIHLLFHWMYFGDTVHLQTCLDQGTVQWEGLVRNVEYLGLTTDIKVFLGRWYDRWLMPSRRQSTCQPSFDAGDADLESDGEDEDLDDTLDDGNHSSSSSHTDEEVLPERGRPRITRPISQLCEPFRTCAC